VDGLPTEWLQPLVDRERNRELERYVKRQTGLVPPYTRYFGECPWIIHADVELDVGFVDITHLTPLLYLTVSRDNSCRFCYGASRMLMRMGGMSDAQISKVELDVETGRLDQATRLALDYARRISRSNPPPGVADRHALVNAGFGERAIKELAFFACEVIFHNRFATLLADAARPAHECPVPGDRWHRGAGEHGVPPVDGARRGLMSPHARRVPARFPIGNG